MASTVENSGPSSSVETRSAEEIEDEEIEIEIKKRGAPYKYGWVVPFLQKFPLEDEEHISNSEYYSSSDYDSDSDERPLWRRIMRDSRPTNTHEVVKRFLKQVRESNGYDVDCVPPPRFWSPFQPEDPDFKGEPFRTVLLRATNFAIDKINVETGKNYKLVEVEKAVSVNFMYLLTLTVMEDVMEDDAAVDASVKTLRAMVNVPYSPKEDLWLEEWMYKPPSPAIESVGPNREKAKIGEGTNNFERLSSADKSIMAHLFSMLDNKSAINLSLSCKSCCSAWVPLKKSLD